ncbi:MAG: hypothetical protein ABJL67_09665 [Sulfitobacter sp.]
MDKLLTFLLFTLAMTSSVWAACVAGQASNRLFISDGIIIDPSTGLEWQMCLHGQSLTGAGCSGNATEVSWLEVDRLAQGIGWRLPKLEDLATVLERVGDDDGGVFPKPFGVCQKGQIWTASPGFPVNDVAAVLE